MLDQHLLSMRSCFAAQLDMVGFESGVLYFHLLSRTIPVYFAKITSYRYLKCNIAPEEKFPRNLVRLWLLSSTL